MELVPQELAAGVNSDETPRKAGAAWGRARSKPQGIADGPIGLPAVSLLELEGEPRLEPRTIVTGMTVGLALAAFLASLDAPGTPMPDARLLNSGLFLERVTGRARDVRIAVTSTVAA